MGFMIVGRAGGANRVLININTCRTILLRLDRTAAAARLAVKGLRYDNKPSITNIGMMFISSRRANLFSSITYSQSVCR